MRPIHFETSTYSNISQVINTSKNKVFYIKDFNRCGSYTAVRSELVRLEQEGMLIRLARGIYMQKNIAKKYSISEIIDFILEDFAYRYGILFYPTGLFFLYKVGIISDLPKYIELVYENKYQRKINVFNKHHIMFKYSSCVWITKILDADLKNLLIALSLKWKGYNPKKKV